MIVNFFEPSTTFDLAPEDAINYFTAKGLATTWNWYEMMNGQHDTAFTVAKMMDIDLLSTVKAEVDKAIAEGTTLQDFKKTLIPKLQQAGWWGQKDIVDSMGNVSKVQLGSASRLETIFRTNLQSSYASGHWASVLDNAESMPYLMYDAVDDSRTRPSHRKFDGKVYRVDAKFWKTHFPPNGYNCRCGVIQMDADEVKANGLTVSDDPELQPLQWTNPKTGEVFHYSYGTDPGFAYNAGESYYSQLQQTMQSKIDALAPDEAAAAQKGFNDTMTAAAKDKAVQQEIDAGNAAKAAIAKAQAITSAKAELKTIAEGNALKQASIKKQVFDKFTKNGTAASLANDPTELLAKITEEATKIQAQKEKTSTINGYKNKVLAGKLPSASQQALYDSLTEKEQAKIIADIDKKKAEKAAADALEAQVKAEQADATMPADSKGISANGINQDLHWENMKQIGGQTGSNLGGTYYDQETGKKYYIKRPKNEAMARNEVLAAKLYEQAGIEVPNVNLMLGQDGTISVASEIIDGLSIDSTALKSGTLQNINSGFAVDAWLANWDVVGLGYDNMLVKGNKVLRLDTGGALKYRAQGSLKGDLWNYSANEIKTLRDPNINPQSAAVFAHVTDADIKAGIAKIAAISDDQITAMVKQFADPKDYDIATTLIERKKALAKLYDVAAQATPRTLKMAEDKLKNTVINNKIAADDALTAAIKGMNKAFADTGIYRPKDLDRIEAARQAINALLSNTGMTDKALANMREYYEGWITKLETAYKDNTTLQGAWFSSYTGDVKFTDDAVNTLAAKLGDLPPTTNEEGTKILADVLSTSEATSAIRQNGPLSLQDKYVKLTDAHKRAIGAYTGNAYYRTVNYSLYTKTGSEKWLPYVNLLNEALEYSDHYEGVSTRALSLNTIAARDDWYQRHLRAYEEDKPVRYLAFCSSTKGDNSAFSGETNIVFHSKKGVHINPISRHPGVEDEVLFGAGQEFYVISVEKRGSGLVIHVKDAPDGIDVEPDLEFMES